VGEFRAQEKRLLADNHVYCLLNKYIKAAVSEMNLFKEQILVVVVVVAVVVVVIVVVVMVVVVVVVAVVVVVVVVVVPSSNAGQGSQCRPVGLSRYVGPSAIPRKFPAILGTESHGRNSKEHNYPRSHDYITS